LISISRRHLLAPKNGPSPHGLAILPTEHHIMRILVATDGSAPALRAVEYAIQLDRRLRTRDRITLISVHDDTALRHARSLVGRAEVDDYLRELGEKDVEAALRLLDEAGVAHDVELRIGHVAQEIVRCADQGAFDLVVVGAKGRGAMADLLLGSVAQRVLALSGKPVLVVK
jgi:nucleotide-binding universal stress UspA family protein